MIRLSLVPDQSTTLGSTPAHRPNVAAGTSYVVCCAVGSRWLVRTVVPDGTAPDNQTVIDCNADGTFTAMSLTAGQRNALKTFLTNQGYDVGQFDVDGVDDRRKLLRFILRRLAGRADLDGRAILSGFGVH